MQRDKCWNKSEMQLEISEYKEEMQSEISEYKEEINLICLRIRKKCNLKYLIIIVVSWVSL